MLSWAFLVLALVAGAMGYSGISAAAACRSIVRVCSLEG
jgi:uncharacterized membrane protein YtjA (UPF0391 family)